MKKLSIIVAFVVMVTGLAAVMSACNTGKANAQTYVAMDINPSVEFVLDENDKVIAVKAANSDAEILLYGEIGGQGREDSGEDRRELHRGVFRYGAEHHHRYQRGRAAQRAVGKSQGAVSRQRGYSGAYARKVPSGGSGDERG